MRRLRGSSVYEYAEWYLLRNQRKQESRGENPSPVPNTRHDRIEEMLVHHKGKMRSWFSHETRWSLVLLDTLEEFERLLFLECEWTRKEGLVAPDGLDYRLLRRVAENARRNEYLTRPSGVRHREYYEQLAGKRLTLVGPDRLAICSTEPSERERNPAAEYYLLDGVGRSLPYMILLQEAKVQYEPVEAFLAER